MRAGLFRPARRLLTTKPIAVTQRAGLPHRPHRFLYSRLAKFDIGPNDTLTAGLAKLGYRIQDVHAEAISHLHQEHIGGLPELGNAQIVITRQEWESLHNALPETRGLMPAHISQQLAVELAVRS